MRSYQAWETWMPFAQLAILTPTKTRPNPRFCNKKLGALNTSSSLTSLVSSCLPPPLPLPSIPPMTLVWYRCNKKAFCFETVLLCADLSSPFNRQSLWFLSRSFSQFWFISWKLSWNLWYWPNWGLQLQQPHASRDNGTDTRESYIWAGRKRTASKRTGNIQWRRSWMWKRIREAMGCQRLRWCGSIWHYAYERWCIFWRCWSRCDRRESPMAEEPGTGSYIAPILCFTCFHCSLCFFSSRCWVFGIIRISLVWSVWRCHWGTISATHRRDNSNDETRRHKNRCLQAMESTKYGYPRLRIDGMLTSRSCHREWNTLYLWW
jgi:hypothetical protein